jgi:hypothetical protein
LALANAVVAHAAAKTRGCAGKEDRSAASWQHQARRFPPGQESRVTGHFPHLTKHSLSGIDEAEVNVCANIEDAYLQRRPFVGAFEEPDHLVFFARVDAARDRTPSVCFDVCDQGRELIAIVLKGVEIERQRIETLAEAERQLFIKEAEGRASATRAQGEAEAEIIFKKGEAEAKAMNVKAEAFQEYNQAAVVDKLITSLPEVVRALSEPLSKVDKVTIVSTGNGDAAGAYKLTGDITKMAAQVPALFEALSGMQMSDLLSKVRLIGDKAPKPVPPTLPSNS